MMKRILLSLLILLLPAPLYAADSAPLTYSRTQLNIMRKGLKLDPSLMPWQQAQAIEANKLPFNIEVRDGRALYNQEGWFNLTSYDDQSGVLLIFSAPTTSPLVRSAQYAPVDVLMIDREGVITQIVPSLQMEQMEQDIIPQTPIMAYLFLQSGLCAKRVIQPGDVVEYKQFKKSPVILGDPAPKAAAPVVLQPPVQIQQDAPRPRREAKLTPARKNGGDANQQLRELYGE